jgi:hypothetical protein
MSATLSDDDATDIADLLGLLEDWLLHAGDDIRQSLAEFAWPRMCDPQRYLDYLIDRLGQHNVALLRQLPTSTPDSTAITSASASSPAGSSSR